MQPLDDGALLRQYATNQSDEAFAALVERHVNLVYSVALRHVGNPHHAEEITQAVFLILARKARQLRHHKALSSWLFQTTRLTANNFLRSEIRRRHREQEASMESTVNETPGAAWSQIADLLDPAVGKLNEKDRQAIVLRYYESRNLRDVGRALGASEKAAEKRVSRALERLRRFFSKRGVTLSATLIATAVSSSSVQAAPAGLIKAVFVGATAEGGAVGASTLALAKGTLRLIAWSKAKMAMIGGACVLLLGASVAVVNGRDSNAPALQFVKNLLENPPAIQECVYTRTLSGSDEFWCVGFHGDDFYALKFDSLEQTEDVSNATEGHGRHANVSWNFRTDTITVTKSRETDRYYHQIATLPVKLGIPTLKLGTLQFHSPTSFAATDFSGEEISGSLRQGSSSSPGECSIAYERGGSKVPMWNVKLRWSPSGVTAPRQGMPNEITLSVGTTASDQQIQEAYRIHRVVTLPQGSAGLDSSPEQIATVCKKKIVYQ